MFNNNSIKIIYFLIQICMLLIMQCVVYIRLYVISSHVIVYIKSTYFYTLYNHIKCIVLNAFIYWVTQKVPSVFKQNYQTNFFHFHQELYWTMYSPFWSTTFCHFGGNVIILSFQNFLSFWEKKLFLVSFTVFQGIELFFH